MLIYVLSTQTQWKQSSLTLDPPIQIQIQNFDENFIFTVPPIVLLSYSLNVCDSLCRVQKFQRSVN